MTKIVISEEQKRSLQEFLDENRPAELLNSYLFFY